VIANDGLTFIDIGLPPCESVQLFGPRGNARSKFHALTFVFLMLLLQS
jgi:hypothetical protein